MGLGKAGVELYAKDKATRSLLKFNKTLGGVTRSLRSVAAVAGVGLGLYGLKRGFDKVTNAAMNQEEVLVNLDTVLKSTAYSALLSRDELVKHAKALQKVTVYGDETIESMQAILLTFKEIKADTFKRTTEVILDMSKALGTDLKSSAIQVGKAINDPVLGVSALTRVGVTFSAAQKEMIKDMAKTGNVAGAQALMLKELESEFGGMSRNINTTRGTLTQMKNALGDVSERIGKAFLPSIRASAKGIKEWAEKNEAAIGKWAEIVWDKVLDAKDAFLDFAAFMKEDWKKGIQLGLDISLVMFAGFGKALTVIMKEAGLSAADAFISHFGKEIGAELMRISDEMSSWGAPVTKLVTGQAGAAIFERANQPPPARESIGSQLEDVTAEMKENIRVFSEAAGFTPERSLAREAEKEMRDTLRAGERQLEGWKLLGVKVKSVVEPVIRGLRGQVTPTAEQLKFEESLSKIIQSLKDETKAYQYLNSERAQSLEIAKMQIEVERIYGEGTEAAKSAIEDFTAVILERDKVLKKSQEDAVTTVVDWKEKALTSTKAWMENAGDYWKNFGQVAASALDGVSDKLTELCITGKANFRDLTRSVLTDLLKMQIRYTMAKFILPGVGGLFAGVMHSGGRAGITPSPKRQVSALDFLGAPRLHIGQNEVPVIAEKGEIFLPAGTPISKGSGETNVVVNLNNESGTPLQAKSQSSHYDSDLKKTVVDLVLQDFNEGGRVYKTLGKKQ